MATLPQPTTARKPQDRDAWMHAQVTQAIQDDQQRPAHAASLKTVARYARLDEVIEGYAIRTADRKVFFLDGTHVIELTNADIPRLTLLGDVEAAERQWTLDQIRHGYAGVATTRNN